MIRRILESSLRFRFLVVTLAVVLMFAGFAQLRAMPVDTLPEFAPPYVEIQTEALGLSAAEVEMLISLPLESLLNGTPWLQTIRSQSVPGLSSLLLIFEPGTDILRVRQLVEERLAVASGAMPNVSKTPVILQPLSATSRVMMIGLSSEELSDIEMSVLTRWNIRPALMGVPGVANVAVWGMRERQLQVQVDPEALIEKGVTLQQVVATTGNALWASPLTYLNASTTGTGGWIDTPNQRLGIRHILPISTPEELAQVMVIGAPYRLGEVATVIENHQPLIGDSLQKNGSGLILVVEKFPGSNSLEVIRGVDERLDTLSPGLTGIQIDSTIFRSSNYIDLAIDNLSRTLLVGMALLAAVLFGLLYNWRAALISLVVIPLALACAVLVLYYRGSTMNTMVFAGLVVAVAVIIDDIIVDVENLMRRLRGLRSVGGRITAGVVVDAFSEIRGPVLYASLILLLAVAPVLLIEGVSGSFFRPLVVAYALAVAASTLVALVVTPALALLLFSGSAGEPRESPPAAWLRRGYERVLAPVLRAPRLVAALVGLLVVVGMTALPFLGRGSLLPSYQEPDVLIQWNAAPGTSHPEMTRLTEMASRELRAITGVRNVAVHVGRAVLSDQVADINTAELWISLDPAADHEEALAAIQDTVEGYPGVVPNVRSYLQETLSQVLTGSSKDVVVRLYGPELETLAAQAEIVRSALSEVEGVVDLEPESQENMPEIQIEVDLARAKSHGIKPGDVRRAAATLLAGLEVGNIFEEQKVFEVVVWGTPQTRHSVEGVRDLLIDTPNGGHVRLGDVAAVTIASSPNRINREAVSRRVDVGFNVSGRDMGSVVADVEGRLAVIDFPLEYHPEVLGEYAERQAAQLRILIAGIAALIGIYLLLQTVFNSWRLAALAFFALPLSLVGGVLAVFLTPDRSLTLGSLLGFLAIFGVTVRGSILLIHLFQRLEEAGMTFGQELILFGARERAVPILMTALTTAFALIPITAAGHSPGHEITYPMAVVVLGGLVTATLLNLIILPALYLQFGRASQSVSQTQPVKVGEKKAQAA